MNKINRLAKKCILLAMEDVKSAIESTYDEDRLLKLSESIRNLSEAYKNIK